MKLIYKIKRKLFPFLIKNEEFIQILEKKGITCGVHTKFFDIPSIYIDDQRPWMLEIGDYCKITKGVIILNHDYSRSVLRRVYGEIIEGSQKTKIGNNVFIGMNSIILMGTEIGNNVIVGAGSIVKGKIPDNVVIAGNPARIICTLDQYYEKRKKLYINEAKICANSFKEKNKRYPTIEEMGAFFPIYLKRDIQELRKNNIFTNLSGDNEEEIINYWLKTSPIYKDYETFLKESGEIN